jgi:rod shape determining protein RodA
VLRATFGKGSPLRHLDWVLLVAVIALGGVGCVLVWAASSKYYFERQLVWLAVGLVLMAAVSMLNYRQIKMLSPAVLVVSILGLLAVLTPLGTTVNGAKSWISLPAGLQIEPSEYAKIAIILLSAMFLSQIPPGRNRPRLRAVLMTLGVAIIPLALVVKQPDLGVAVLLVALLVAMIALSGIRLHWLVLSLGAGALAIYAGAKLHVLKAYQVSRLTSFIHPSQNPRSTGYSAYQAKILIGSGGLFGQGLFHGQLVAGNFVPEQHTDFIFAVAGEELGFVGCAVIVALLGLLLVRALRIASKADDQFGMLVAAGIAVWFAVQSFINIGMTIGLMPVTGLPLPFVSYGGSAIFADMIAIGILQTVHRHRSVFL